MREAVIVSVARTPIGKAYRGAFNNTDGATLGGHAIAEAVKRSGIDAAEIDDVVFGAAVQQGTTGFNIARQAALRAGAPDTVSGMSVDRQCASGLMAIATAAKQILHDGMTITIGGGVESISLNQEHMNRHRAADPALLATVPALYMAMIETAEIVAEPLWRQPRGPGRIRAAIAATYRRGPIGRRLRGRDRPARLDHAGLRQGDRRDLQARRCASPSR